MKKRLLKILPVILILIFSAIMLSACVDADFEVQKAKMAEKNYKENPISRSIEGCEGASQFTLLDEAGGFKETVYILYFTTDNDAILFEEEFINGSYFWLNYDNPTVAETYDYVRVGKIFIHGTEQGVKDALS